MAGADCLPSFEGVPLQPKKVGRSLRPYSTKVVVFLGSGGRLTVPLGRMRERSWVTIREAPFGFRSAVSADCEDGQKSLRSEAEETAPRQ